MVKKICEKKIGNIIYVLKHFKDRYVIYKQDEERWKNGKASESLKVKEFNNEQKAREYLEKLQ